MIGFWTAHKGWTTLLLVVLLALAGVRETALAEGTYELKNKTNSNPDVVLESPGEGGSPGFDLNLPRQTMLRVDIFSANEVIDIYTSRFNNTTDIAIWRPGADPDSDSPDWTFDVTQNDTGYIADWNEVVAVQELASRPRPPATFIPQFGTGAYSIRLFGSQGTAGKDSDGIRFFDVAVRDTTGGGTLKRGRLWSDHYALSLLTFEKKLLANFYVVAGQDKGSYFEGFLWQEGSNGLAPFAFHMYANQHGAEPEAYFSLSVKQSASPTPIMTPLYPIYLNVPEKTVTPPPAPTAENLEFFANCTGATLKGGHFEFDTNGEWEYEIVLDENNDGIYDPTTERTLRGTAEVGHNIIFWDGEFKDGSDAPAQGDIQVKLRNKAGEVHFPFFDVENKNSNDTGPLITLLTGSGGELYFWNDKGPGMPGTATSALPFGSLNPHTWQDDFGNVAIIDTWKFALDAENTIVFTYSCSADIAGRVYNDANHNRLRDEGESGTGLTLFAKLMPDSSPGGPAIQVVTVDPGTGTYTFPDAESGTYIIVIDGDSATADVTPTIPSGWVGTQIPDHIRTKVTSNGKDLPDQDFGLFNGSRIEGTVFVDNGTGGGTANDGSRNGGEVGLGGVTVKVTTAAGTTVFDQTVSRDRGDYTLWVPAAAGANPLEVVAINLVDHISTGGQAGTTGGTYDRSMDAVAFTHSVGSSYSEVDFGDVAENNFAASGQQTVLPGTVAFYPHTFKAGTAGRVTFSSPHTANPNITGWTNLIYLDSNCNDSLDTGEPVISGPIDVAADQRLCIIVKEFVPPNAAFGAQDLIMVTADFDYTNALPPFSTSYRLTDLTVVSNASNAGLNLTKKVDKSKAKPGETITYTIIYKNNSTEALRNIKIFDGTPTFTTFNNATYSALPDSLTDCVIESPPIGTGGAIKWILQGTLMPGGQGEVSYSVTIN